LSLCRAGRAYVTLVHLAITLAASLFVGLACTAEAPPRRIRLAPPMSEVAFRAYGLGLLPIDARFTRFDGWLTYDPADRGTCQVNLRVHVDSLVTDDPSMRDRVVGPDFMDATSFPILSYAGSCKSQGRRAPRNTRSTVRPCIWA
jgi:polyisoprenoid-binding protein YceI